MSNVSSMLYSLFPLMKVGGLFGLLRIVRYCLFINSSRMIPFSSVVLSNHSSDLAFESRVSTFSVWKLFIILFVLSRNHFRGSEYWQYALGLYSESPDITSKRVMYLHLFPTFVSASNLSFLTTATTQVFSQFCCCIFI